ncbi:MAG: hypothetical protein B7Y39_16795 [Bdellovibrio sp. 28-41-41]|nr:MAG: hypothetical protein B7Y39_16795 [Bdellovibrio sp. 28-41-41]
MKYLLSCICLTFSIFSSAGVYSSSAPLHSALRGYREPAAAALQRYRQRLAQYGIRSIQEDTPLGLAKPLDMLTYEKVPAYQNATVATQSFVKVRDAKFIKDVTHNMVRRSSWIFPDDGCFARAMVPSAGGIMWFPLSWSDNNR